MNPITKILQKIKRVNQLIDELSLFLIFIALILSILIMLLRLNRLVVFLAWILLFIAYWRACSKNRLQRIKENQIFIKHYYHVKSYFKNLTKRFLRKEAYTYFKCKSCKQQLRIPKKTNHIKVTCPKCNYSFTKNTPRGYINKLRKK